MFSTVGPFLPGIAQGNTRANPPTSPECRPDSQRSSKRKLAERHSIDRISMAQRSSEEVSRSTAFTSISTAFRFVDFVAELNEASSEIHSLVTVIQRVREDISTALWLRAGNVVTEYCEQWPDNRTWIDNILLDVQAALNDIGAYVENVRVSGTGDEGAAVKMRHKFEWVTSHQHKVRDRQNTLLVCHQSLSSAINLMQLVQMSGAAYTLGGNTEGTEQMIYEAPAAPWMHHEEGNSALLKSPHLRHKHRLSQRNLSVPNITASQLEGSELEVKPLKSDHNILTVQGLNFEPAELAGSTPEGLPGPGNLDCCSLPPNPPGTATDSSSISTVTNNTTSATTPPTDDPIQTTIPQVAKRYRARRVTVNGPNGRNRSLPSQLPHIPHTNSLVSELTRWVEDYSLEANHIDNDTDTLTAVTNTNVTAPTSTASSPTSAASCPVRMGSFSSAISQGPSDKSPKYPPATIAFKRKSLPPRADGDYPTLPQEETVAPAPIEEPTEVVVHTDGTPAHLGLSETPDIDDTKDHENHEETAIQFPSTETLNCSSSTNDAEKEKPEKQHASASPTSETTPDEPTTHVVMDDQDDIPPPLPPRPKFTSQTATNTNSAQNTVPLMSSHAKRRKAHHRRMQAVYDRDSD